MVVPTADARFHDRETPTSIVENEWRGLRDTGERIVPQFVADDDVMAQALLHQHVERYRLAAAEVAGKRVLDAACGAGYGAAILADAGARDVLAVDVDESALRHAQVCYQRGRSVRFQPGDVCDLRLRSSIEVATFFEALEHVAEPRAALTSLRRVLAPGGVLFISAVVYPTTNLYRYHLRDYTQDTFRKEVEDAGFRVVDAILQSQQISARHVRRAMVRHRRSFPLNRFVTRPGKVLRDVWRSHVSEGLLHEDVTLRCVKAE